MDVLAPGLNYIWSIIPDGFSSIIFSLALINSPKVHSDNIRGQLANRLVEHAAFGTYSDPTPPFTSTITTQRQQHKVEVTATATAATITTTIFTSTLSTGTGNTTLNKPTGANFITALPSGIAATPTITVTPTPTPINPPPPYSSSSSSIFLPFETCLLAIFSLAVELPTPSPALSTALFDAEYSLPASAVAAPSCTITLPASLSSEYDVYTSSLDSWVSEHSKELEKLDSVCGETFTETGTGSGVKTVMGATGATKGVVGCTAPVAVFTGAVSTGDGDGNGSSTAMTTTTLFKSSTTAVVTSTKKTTGTTTGSVKVTTTTSTVTSLVTTSSITGSVTTVAVVTSSQPPTEPQSGGSVRGMNVVTAMVVVGFWAIVGVL